MWRSFATRTRSSFPNPRARLKLHVDAPVAPAQTVTNANANCASPPAPRAAMPGANQSPSAVVVESEGDARPTSVYRPGRWDIWILGLAIGLGGQYFSWNAGLAAGLYTFMLIYLVVGFAYITLCCCTSEITGALPFAGGAYGLSRCTLGFYAGFIIGCAEALEYIVYVSTSVLSLADMLVESIPELAGLEPLIWLLFYVSSLYVHIRGDYIFWRWNMVIGVLSLFFVLLYCIGSFPHTNFAANADNDPDFRYVHGIRGFLRSLPLSCWFFVGVEALSLATDDVLEPKIAIPFAQVSCILALFASGIVVLFVTVSLPPPGLNQVSKLLAPFDNGFQLLFDVSVKTATLFSIPAMYATTFGFMWGYGKLIAAMATSKLLPPVLARPHPRYGTAYWGLLSGSVLGYFVCLLVFFVPAIKDKYVFNICIAMAFLGYAGQCIGYIALKRNYPSIKSSAFRSPFGIYGAVYSLIVWLLGLTSIAFFQENGGIEISVFFAVLIALTLVYFGYAQSRQTLSSKEHKVFLQAHVMKFNKDKSRRTQYTSGQPHVRPSASPTRLIAATGLVRPALTLAQLGRRDNGSQYPLKLPIAPPLLDPTPFHRQFTSPPPKNPYNNDDPHEIRDASCPRSSVSASSLVSMIVAATDGVIVPMRSASFTGLSGVSACKQQLCANSESLGGADSIDALSDISSDDAQRLDSVPSLSASLSERASWTTLRYSSFAANVGYVGESDADPVAVASTACESDHDAMQQHLGCSQEAAAELAELT